MLDPTCSTPDDTRIRLLFHITDFNDGGIESSLIQWLRILDRERFHLALSVTYRSPAFESRYRALIPKDVSVEVLVDRPSLGYFQKKRYARQLGKLGRIARDIHNALLVRPHMAARIEHLARKADVIVDFDMSLRRLAGRFNVAWLGVNHFSFDARLGGRPRRIRRMLQQYQRYESIVALTEHMADEATQMFDGQLTRLVVLPNAIDIESIRERAALPVASTAPDGASYIVSVARLDEIQKDHRTLLRAYAELRNQHAIAEHLVIVGDGAYRDELQSLTQELGVAECVHFIGHQDNPYPTIANASVLVLSSKYEGMPMVLLEALALGKAIVATDCPTGPREILDDGKAGTLVPIGDTRALASALARLLTDDRWRTVSAANAVRRASYYGIEESNRRLVACIEAMLPRTA
ncbi:glycosyltransferase [Paraburkholderia sp. DHOC27]|uniref:glycosyltransferase n=1 Tax=Paraburkholderia sp. DHOC27 TaxID=2303330 RepID=UPI000E3E4751|nr:glycosyltransferase [Paraburkholderia sp. DHOC27]RFU48288.1 glycosyltransferase [Paraburkholderia sp. DHOC27]